MLVSTSCLSSNVMANYSRLTMFKWKSTRQYMVNIRFSHTTEYGALNNDRNRTKGS